MFGEAILSVKNRVTYLNSWKEKRKTETQFEIEICSEGEKIIHELETLVCPKKGRILREKRYRDIYFLF